MDLDVMRVRDSIPILVGDGVSESEVALRFILFIGGSIASFYLVDMLLRKILKVEKRSSEVSYVNDLHKKWDKIVRIGSGSVLIVLALIVLGFDFPIRPSLFLPIAILPISPIVLRIGFEKKYAKNPNEYLHTLLGMGITVVIMGTLLFVLSPGF